MNKYARIAFLSTIILISIALHLVPFFMYGAHPLGYDTGFYRRYLIQTQVSFPNAPVPGLGDDALIPRIVFDILRALHIPTDIILYGSYIALFSLLALLIYFWLRPRLGERGALLASAMTALSPIAYAAYWYMLWKNFFALSWLILAFIAIEKRWWRALFAIDIVIALSHKTTAIVYILSLAVLFVLRPSDRRWLFAHAGATAAVFSLANLSIVHVVTLSTPVGVFLSWSEYISYSLPLVILIVCGTLWKEKKIPATLLAFSIVTISFPLLHLPFYERIFVFSDVALVALAAFACERIISEILTTWGTRKGIMLAAALCVALGLFLGTLWDQVRTLLPLAPDSTFTRIEALSKELPENATILTSSDEAPLFEGWSVQHIAAPGMLHDNHNYEAWTVLWSATSSRTQTVFLQDFPRPFYVATFNRFENLIGTPAPCMRKLSPYLYEACAVK